MTRTDPYQKRARELCAAAGIDPDSKVDRGPGLRPMPAWCLYRQAAIDETASRTSRPQSAAIAAQAPAYRNSPLLVIGRHEDATVAQMKTCMTIGNAVAGVVCADGHLGYAQPVGGVIAYDKQVSVSGVSFDIGCGNMAARLDTRFADIRDRVEGLAREISRKISFGIGRINEERVEHALFDDREAWRASGMEA